METNTPPQSNKKVYDLDKLEDRLKLASELLDLDAGQLLTIEDDMFKKGYRGHLSDMDKKMYYYLGHETYDGLSEQCFRYTCLEAEFLGVPLKGDLFKRLNMINRENMWSQSKELIPYNVCLKKKLQIKRFYTDEEINVHIRSKWKSKPTNLDFLKSHHDLHEE